MKILLDTQVFLWYISANQQLPAAFQTAVLTTSNEVYLSVVSVWEAVIKHALGKLPFPSPPAIYLPRERKAHAIESLEISEAAMPFLASLPSVHKDPFDRLLVAQALQHGMTLATVDQQLLNYPVSLLPVV